MNPERVATAIQQLYDAQHVQDWGAAIAKARAELIAALSEQTKAEEAPF